MSQCNICIGSNSIMRNNTVKEEPMVMFYRQWILQFINNNGGKMDESPLKSSVQVKSRGAFDETQYQCVLDQLVSDGTSGPLLRCVRVIATRHIGQAGVRHFGIRNWPSSASISD